MVELVKKLRIKVGLFNRYNNTRQDLNADMGGRWFDL